MMLQSRITSIIPVRRPYGRTCGATAAAAAASAQGGGLLVIRRTMRLMYSTTTSTTASTSSSSTTDPKNLPSTTTTSRVGLPSTLTGPPMAALIKPGHCQFGLEPIRVPLLERTQVSPTSSVLRFGLPDAARPLNLSTCACILATAVLESGEKVTRPYTPISTNVMVGAFDLLVKDYGEGQGKMSRHLCHVLQPGTADIAFTHIPANVKIQAPFDRYSHVIMLVGGTGITPMIQALHAILGSTTTSDQTNSNSTTKVTMLYGNRNSQDILGKELLDAWVRDHGSGGGVANSTTSIPQLEVVHVLSDEPTHSTWDGRRGFITRELLEKYIPTKGDADAATTTTSTTTTTATTTSLMIMVCGPPPMYQALCGPRNQPDLVSGVLGEMGYQPHQVYKF